MKKQFVRLLSLLLVCLLLTGVLPSAMAAPADEPNDPENPYPYGLPMTDVVPPEILERISGDMADAATTAADNQGDIPDEMWDNTILRALEYTGYDVQRQKDRGQLYEYHYFGSRLKENDPSVLSNIGYWRSGPCPNGDETVSDPTTVTGKAPNIAYFEAHGLVCASFVTYYLCNYLPNIEGIDTSKVYEMAKQKGTENGAYYLTATDLWKNTLDALAGQADGGVTKYTDQNTAYAHLVPGDVIVFASDSGSLAHVGIYAGAYNLYSYGTSLGLYHYMIHVGNSRGPEINVVEWMHATGTEKDSYPIAWYHLDFNDMKATGAIEVYKQDPNGQNLAGACFTATDTADGTSYLIGPTDSSGYAVSGELPLSTYTVVESVFPAGYTSSGQTSWTVTLDKDTPNATVTIHAVNKQITGKAQILKATTNGGSRAGWHFSVKDQSGKLIGNYVTDDSGQIALELVPGTYTVTETDGEYKYWRNDPEPTKTVTVKANETATVTFTNQWRGQAQIVKTLENPEAGSLEGWVFSISQIVEKDGQTEYLPIATVTTDASGTILRDLEPGNYRIQEELPEGSLWQCASGASQVVTVKAGQTATVTFANGLRPGEIRILKTDPQGQPLEGTEFLLEWSSDGNTWQAVTFSDAASPVAGGCTSPGLSEGRLRSDSDGIVAFTGLYPTLQYRLSETTAKDGYQLLEGYAFEGTLPQETLTVTLTVVNAQVFRLPDAGGNGFSVFPVFTAVCWCLCFGLGLLTYRGKKRG